MIAALAPFLPFYVVGILIGGQAAEKPREGETRIGSCRANGAEERTVTLLALDDDEAVLRTTQDNRRSRLYRSSDKLASRALEPIGNVVRQCAENTSCKPTP